MDAIINRTHIRPSIRHWSLVSPKRANRTTTYDWEKAIGLDDLVNFKPKTVTSKRENSSSQLEHPGFNKYWIDHTGFCTNSAYEGEWDSIGTAGMGKFFYAHRVEYEGQLNDGTFHDEGTLTFPMGQKLEGEWSKGRLTSFKFTFGDGLEYSEPWKYCAMPDRRFLTSILEGMRPTGRSFLTNQQPTRTIPEGCYDTGDGYYNPKTKCVMSAIKPKKILRVPTVKEEEWIIANCRKAWDQSIHHRPDLYERWVNGKKNNLASVNNEDGSGSSTYSTDSSSRTTSTSSSVSAPEETDKVLSKESASA